MVTFGGGPDACRPGLDCSEHMAAGELLLASLDPGPDPDPDPGAYPVAAGVLRSKAARR